MNPGNNLAIRTEALSKNFDSFCAVDRVSMTVERGEILGCVGPNGSGKTTTIRMLLGLLLPSSGSALVLGFDATSEAERIRPQVGYVSQKFALYDELTTRENLEFYAGVYGIDPRDDRARIDEVLQLTGLSGQQTESAGDLAGGWRQRLALAVSLVHRPELLFLDEPTSGVDPVARRLFWDLIYTLAEGGTTVFVTTHYMDEAERCDRVGFMHRGRLLALDTPNTLRETTLKGVLWEITAHPLTTALDFLPAIPGVQRAGLAGDRLRAVTLPGTHTAESLQSALQAQGLTTVALAPTTPTLEDVFISLVKEREKGLAAVPNRPVNHTSF